MRHFSPLFRVTFFCFFVGFVLIRLLVIVVALLLLLLLLLLVVLVLVPDGGDLLGDGGDLLGDGGKKCDLPTDQPTYLHLTWVGARDACASKNGTAPHSMQQLHCTMWCTAHL